MTGTTQEDIAPEADRHPGSLVDRALTVTAAARRMLAGEEERVEAERVLKRIGELDGVLDQLAEAVALAEALAEASGAPVDTSAAHRGLDQFARLASGRPPDTVFNRARKAAGDATTAIRQAVADGWAGYTTTAVAALPLHRLAVLPATARDAAGARERDLRSLAKRPAPTPAQVQRFADLHAQLATDLDAVPDPPAELRLLLERLEQGAVPLSMLDDHEVALLRQVADQIEVRRKRS